MRIETINAAALELQHALRRFGVMSVFSGADENVNAGLFVSETICVSVAEETAYVSVQRGEQFDFMHDHPVTDVDAIYADLRQALSQ